MYHPETKTCLLLTRDKVSYLNYGGSHYRLYVLRPTKKILYFSNEMEYNDAEKTCQAYGGRLYFPGSLSDIQMLQSRNMDGYVGLTKLTGEWLRSDGQPFTDTSLWSSYFPTNNGPCARVNYDTLVDCSCTRTRNFACLLEL